MRSFSHLQLIQPALAERALRASGMGGVGNRIPGSQVLYAELRRPGFTIKDCFETMTDLQLMAIQVCAPPEEMSLCGRVLWMQKTLAAGTRLYQACGGQGPCRCLHCRVRCMWMERLEEALSEE